MVFSIKKFVLPLFISLVAVAALPSFVNAASIDMLEECTIEGGTAAVTGGGFTPGASYTVKRSKKTLGTGTVDENGEVAGSFSAPTLPSKSKPQRKYTLEVSDGTNTATTTFKVTKFYASFSPQKGTPQRLKVRFKGAGFGIAKSVYLHVIAPNGKRKKTVKIGKTTGSCGVFKSKKRKLFPFNKIKFGVYTFQVDTRRKYSKKAPRVTLPVSVFRRFR